MSAFLHDLCNVLAIIQGNICQAERLLASFEENESTLLLKKKLDHVLKEIERAKSLMEAEQKRKGAW